MGMGKKKSPTPAQPLGLLAPPLMEGSKMLFL